MREGRRRKRAGKRRREGKRGERRIRIKMERADWEDCTLTGRLPH